MDPAPDRQVDEPIPRGKRALRFVPGLVLGVGFGAMLDGLLFHELLQWHHFLSDVEGYSMHTMEGLEENTLADGLFHLFAMVVSFIGVVLLWRAGRDGALPDSRITIGAVVIGWAAFDIVDGLVIHLLLSLHHLYQDDFQVGSDLVYVAANVVLGVLGYLFARSRPAGT